MGTFSSERQYMIAVRDLTPVGQAVMEHFRGQGFTVTGEPTITRGWCISITRGNLFSAVAGMQTALNIEIEPTAAGVRGKAGVGIFGKQAIPTVISMFVFWPVLLTQLWGMVQQAKLDDEALDIIEQHLHATPAPPPTSVFCTECGTPMPEAARFCPGCGTDFRG